MIVNLCKRGVNTVSLIMSPDTNHCLIDNHLTRRTPLTIPLRRQKTKRGAVRTNDDIRVMFMLHMDPVKTRGGVQGVP